MTGALAGVQRWEPALANPITAYRDTDGKLYVVNGHQRFDLATRAEAAGQQNVQIPARVYDAADGLTSADMRALGAYQNIAEGSGTAVDAAKIMRNAPPGMTPPALPPQSALVQQARNLTGLSDQAFGAVANGVVSAAYGAEVGAAIRDPQQQLAAISMLHRLDPANVEQARIMVQDIRNSGFLTSTQAGLFGDEDVAQSLFDERAKVLAQAMQNLRGNRRVFKAAVEGEDALTAAGNTMDTTANQQGQTANDQLIDTLQRDATTRGPLSDTLTAAARAVASGKQVRGAAADFLAQARAIANGRSGLGLQRGAGYDRAGPARAGGQDGSSGPADDVGPPQDGPGLFSARDPAAPSGQGQRPATDPARMQALAESVMRYTGAGKGVALRLVDSIDSGRADGSYANKLITFAMDTKPSDVPGKLFHEIVHAMRDPTLGLLKPGERAALDQAAFKFLKQGTNRADIVARYGDEAGVVHEEAIARLAEQAHARAGSQPPYITRLADRMRNFVVGLGQALRGRGFMTADDVFRSMMRGDRSGPEEHAALAQSLADSMQGGLDPATRAASSAPDPQSIPDAVRQVRANTPETYFARRDPKMTDKEWLERAGQASMFGRNDAAVQAQAARDAAGGLRGRVEQKPLDEGLFAPREPNQGALFSLREPIPSEPTPPASKKENQDNAARAIERVLATGESAYHAAYRKDLGWVSFLNGDANAGIQHIIKRRGEDGVDGKALVRTLPAILTYGHAGPFYMDRNGALKRNVVWNGRTAVLQMTHDGERLTWVLTGFDGMKAVPREGKAISQADAQKMIADALNPGGTVRDLATQQGHQPDLRAPAPRPQPTSEGTASGPRESVISAPAGSGERDLSTTGSGGKAGESDIDQLKAGEDGSTPSARDEPMSDNPIGGQQPQGKAGSDPEQFSLRDGRSAEERQRDSTNLALAFQQPRSRLPMVRAIADDALRILSPTSLRGAKPAEFLIRRNAAEQARSYARTVADLSDMRDAINALPVDQQLTFTARMEAGQRQATPELQAVADMLRKSYDGWAGKIQSLGKGLLEHTIENYLPHVWANYAEWKAGLPPDPDADPMARAAAGAGSKSPIRGSGAFLKQRNFETQEAGMKAGLVPISTNPVDVAMIKLREMQKMYHGTRMAEEMKQTGIAQWVPVDGQSTAAARSAGWVKLDDSVFQPTSMQNGGQMTHGAWWAAKAPARIFNNYVSRGLSGKPIYDALRAGGNALNALQLGLSGLHATFVTMDSAMSKVALGLRQLSRGDVAKGAGNVAMGLPPAIPVAAAMTVRRGAALRKAILYPDAATPELRRIADMAMQAGAWIGQQQIFRTEAAGSFVRNLRDFTNGHMAREVMATFRDAPGPGPVKLITGTAHAVGRVLETIMHPLMDLYVPRAKLGVFADMARDWTEAHPDATPEATADAMTKAWDSVDNRLGQLVYDNLFWSKTLKDTAFVATRSVGWNIGTIREIGGGAVDTAAWAAKLARGGSPEITHRMAYIAAMPMVTAMVGSMLTYLRTGQGPQQLLDYFYPPDGKGGRTAIPGYIKDVIDYSRAPIQTLANKTHPLVSVAQQIHTNRDYYGGIIYDSQRDNPVQAYLEYALNQVIPFSIRSIKKENSEGMSSLDRVAAFWGFQPAPAAITNPEREQAWEAKDNAKAYRKREREQGRITLP